MSRSGPSGYVGKLLHLGAIASLAGCSVTPPPKIGLASTEPVAADGQSDYAVVAPTDYHLRPDDVISVIVFREPSLSLEKVPIGADGTLSLPFVGIMKVAGQTPEQFAGALESRLGDGFLTNPRVSVNVMEYASHLVTVEGAVEEPGIYKFQPGTRLSGAIALAKGTEQVANARQVAVFRTTPQGIAVAKFDYAAMQEGTMIDPVLQPNDRVVVGTSTLSQFWRDLIQTLPAFALFTNI